MIHAEKCKQDNKNGVMVTIIGSGDIVAQELESLIKEITSHNDLLIILSEVLQVVMKELEHDKNNLSN